MASSPVGLDAYKGTTESGTHTRAAYKLKTVVPTGKSGQTGSVPVPNWDDGHLDVFTLEKSSNYTLKI